MSDVAFVDSNILIYAHDRDASSKRERAAAVLDTLWESGDGRLSVQVLQEFFVNATGKLNTPLARTTAREVVQTYAVWVRESTTANTVTRAIDIAELAQLSFWDALIVASAEQAGATLLYSEDLNDGQKIVGVTVRNPLVETIGKT
jgi:predicted nucleic acid-binding protein